MSKVAFVPSSACGASRRSRWYLFLALSLIVGACGGDDDDGKGDTGSGGKSAAGSGGSGAAQGGRNAAGGQANAGGAAGSGMGTGTGPEGTLCETAADCGPAFRCSIADVFETDDGTQYGVSVCARPCGGDGQNCDDGEECITLTNKAGDLFCQSVTDEAFGACGASATSVCGENLTCLTLITDDPASLANGVCVQPCALPNAPMPPANAPACPSDLTCLNPLAQQNIGVCAKPAQRGESCEVEEGAACVDGNLCISDGSQALCYQDCSTSKTCDDSKTCKDFPDGSGSYCE